MSLSFLMAHWWRIISFFFFQAEDGIRDYKVTGVQTCALPISPDDRNTSFFSGHTSFAFTSATLLCFQHGRLNLYGAADGVVCPAALAVASLTGLLRIGADRHWATDVLTGAALGAAAGTVVSITHISSENGRAGQAASSGASIAFAF